MFFGEDFLERLTSRLDIVDVVSKYVRIERRGGNYFGLCPFHAEKTPSFSVSAEKQIYHCFGCGAGGGVINFIMRIENLEFHDAIEMLAKQVNLPLPEENRSNEAVRRKIERFAALNADAARHFYGNLSSEEGKPVLNYIKRRALKPETVNRFGMGFSKDSWDDLINAMRKKGYTDSELTETGLAVRNERGIYDRFRNRLMFPIIDVRGRVIGFGGRVMDDSMPKYLNSSDSLIFNKSRNLYGLNLAKGSKQHRMILVEGYMDVIALHQAGFDCAVASLGTSLTAEQARLLGRYSKDVHISYDADAAGRAAARRAIEVMKPFGYNVKVVRIPDGKDPDEFIKKHGSAAFESLLKLSEHHTEYRLMEMADEYDFKENDQRIDFVREAAELLSKSDSRAEIEVYAERTANLAGVSRDAVLTEVERAARRESKRGETVQKRKDTNVTASAQPRIRGVRYENIRSARAEEGVLMAICLKPALFDLINDKITTENFSSPHLAAIFGVMEQRIRNGLPTDISSLSQELASEQIDILSSILFEAVSEKEIERALKDCADILILESTRTRGSEGQPDPLLATQDRYREKKGYGG